MKADVSLAVRCCLGLAALVGGAALAFAGCASLDEPLYPKVFDAPPDDGSRDAFSIMTDAGVDAGPAPDAGPPDAP